MNSSCFRRNWAQLCKAGAPFEAGLPKLFSCPPKVCAGEPKELLMGDVTPGACATGTLLVVELITLAVVVVVVVVVGVVLLVVNIGKLTATPCEGSVGKTILPGFQGVVVDNFAVVVAIVVVVVVVVVLVVDVVDVVVVVVVVVPPGISSKAIDSFTCLSLFHI